MFDLDGNGAQATFQVADINRPLTSVSKICDKGNVVIFTSKGGYVHNLHSGARVPFAREANIYALEMWVARPGDEAQSGFTRRSPH